MASEESFRRNVPAGGSATINGVLYQMLWSLLRASNAHIVDISQGESGVLEKTTLTLEPIGGGGDLVVGSASIRIVEQVKARPDGGTWSLREVIEDVIPDLYLASSTDAGQTEFRFVTEGRMGQWNNIYKFFRSLSQFTPPDDELVLVLDAEIPLRFGGIRKDTTTGTSSSFWERDVYTEATLFEKIVTEVRKRKPVQLEPIETTRRQLWTVLSRFTFHGGQSSRNVQEQIDSRLLELVDYRENIPAVRNAMAFDLAQRAAAGSAIINVSEFMWDHGLGTVPLSNWSLFRTKAQEYVDRFLVLHDYVQDLDVRFETANTEFGCWRSTQPVLLISGESGQGKSWRAYATAMAARSKPCATIIVDSAGKAEATVELAAKVLWNEVGNHDAQIPFSSVVRRVQDVVPREHFRGRPWLLLVIDGIQESGEVECLIKMPWEEWGVRALLVYASYTPTDVESQEHERCVQCHLSDFSVKELQEYLHRAIGEVWTAIPDHIREPLRRPFLAQIYCRLARESNFHPSSAYGIYQSLWDRCLQKEPFGASSVLRLADALLDGSTYPFTVQQLNAVDLDQTGTRRLEQSGWLRNVAVLPRPQFDVPHDRLLNWIVAAALVERLASGKETAESVADRLKSFLTYQTGIAGRSMVYVPMDTLWLMLHDPLTRDQVVEVLNRICTYPIMEDYFYSKLVPTLGDEVVDALINQLRMRLDDSSKPRLIAKAISQIDGNKAKDAARQLLHDDDPRLQRTALKILAEMPLTDVLDRVWEIQFTARQDPVPFLNEHESGNFLQEECYNALRSCSLSSLEWIEQRISEVPEGDKAAEILTRLVAGIGGSEGKALWLRNKQELLEKVPQNSQRCLARCIDVYGDASEIDWLINRLAMEDDIVGPLALSALARFDPDAAIEHLGKVPRRHLVLTRNWYGDRLFAAQRAATQSKFLQLMNEDAEPWRIATLYSGREYLIDAATLDYLLEELSEYLSRVIAESTAVPHEQVIYNRLGLLRRLGTKEQLRVFAQRRETQLTKLLLELLQRIGPRRGIAPDSFLREPAFDVLQRIGGEEYTTAVNRFLIVESQHSRNDAIHRSARRVNSETVGLLQQIVVSDNRWDGTPDGVALEQHAAAEVLADLEEWEYVIKLVSRFSIRTLRQITDFARNGKRPPSEIMASVRSRLYAEMENAAPGDALAIGMGGDSADSTILLDILNRCEPESDVAHACIIGLELLADSSIESIAPLQRLLAYHEYSATNALIVNGTQRAIQALWDHNTDQFRLVALLNGLNHLPYSEQLIDVARRLIAQHLKSNDLGEFNQEMDLLVRHLNSDRIVSELLACEPLREHIRQQSFADEGNFWFTGSKASCLRLLAKFDHEAAFVGVKAAMQNPDSHDRDHYPYILVELSLKDAFSTLLTQLSIEKEPAVSRAICRALLTDGVDDHLLAVLASDDHQIRRAACMAAGWASSSPAVADRLNTLLHDPAPEIADAAASAICRIGLRHECRELAEAIIVEPNREEKWRLLDGLMEISDPGDEHGLWPREGADIGEVLSPLQVHYCLDILQKKRDKLKREPKFHS